jgi:cytochrome c
MKRILVATLVGTGILFSGSAMAQLELAKQKNCLACHNVDKKVVGPAYKDVAAKYAGDDGAEAKLVKKVMEGGSGVWGKTPMPANKTVSDADAHKLVQWILSLKK